MASELRVGNITFAGASGCAAISIEGGRIRDVESQPERSPRWLCVPPLADLHVHANRAFTSGELRPRTLEDAVALTNQQLSSFTLENYESQALHFFERAFEHGTTIVRTHADVDGWVGLAPVRGTLAARAAVRDRIDVAIVAFASSRCDPAESAGLRLLEQSIEAGADMLGAAPAFYPEPQRSIDSLLELASRLDVEVDVHLDEHLDPDRMLTEYMAEASIRHGLVGRVTISHACALSALPATDRVRVIERLVEARITIIALPTTNLYLQDRDRAAQGRRGLTCVRALLAAGVAVRFGSDNVRDVFYPFGDADLLDVAMTATLAAQLEEPVAIVAAICAGRDRPRPGDPADFVLLEGGGLDDVLARRPAERVVVRHGRVVLGDAHRLDSAPPR